MYVVVANVVVAVLCCAVEQESISGRNKLRLNSGKLREEVRAVFLDGCYNHYNPVRKLTRFTTTLQG